MGPSRDRPRDRARPVAATLAGLFTASVMILVALAGPALSHSFGNAAGTAPRGVPIPSLTHGQMAAIADYRSEILGLAARQTAADEGFRRIRNYASIQYALCAWNLFPGGVTEEASPFNGCMHAYLAAVQELLQRMRAMPEHADAVSDLATHIESAMLRVGAALSMCRYSEDEFDTAHFIGPDWSALPAHTPTVLSLLGILLLLSVAVFALCWTAKRVADGRDIERRSTEQQA